MFESLLKGAESLAKSMAGRSNTQEKNPLAPKDELVSYQIFPFKDNENGVSNRHAFLKNFVKVKSEIQFVVQGNTTNSKFFVVLPHSLKGYFENVFYSAYNTSDLLQLKQNITRSASTHYIHFKKKAEIAVKDYYVQDGDYIDPLRDLLAIFSSIPKDSQLTLFFTYRFYERKNPFKHIYDFVNKGVDLVRNGSKATLDDPKKVIEGGEDVTVKIYQQHTKEIFLAMGFALQTSDHYLVTNIQDNIEKTFGIFLQKGKLKIRSYAKYHPMSRSQAINFFHIPTKTNFVKGLEYAVYRKLPYPGNIPTIENSQKNDITVLGNTDFKGEKMRFGIRNEDKMRHVYVVGKTGTGKSTFLSNMVKSDMITGKGLCLIDPHGDLVDTVLEHVPSYRSNDVILFDIGDSDFPIGFNLLQYKTQDEKLRIVSGVVSVFNKMFGHSRGPRLEYILRNVLLTIVDYPNATILHLMRVLVDKEFREEVLTHLKDQVILKFWRSEFDKWQERQVQEAISPITNKVGQFLSSSLVRNIFGQPQTKLNIREAMDSGKIILINLSKGRIGEDNAKMVGSLLVTKIQIDAMSRADVSHDQRKDFMLYIDEFQNFATDSFAEIMSEARKYRLSLIVANQFTAQLQENVRDAIFGNVGTIISFTLGRDDAEMMAKQYKEMVSPNDLLSLPKFKAYSKLMIDGVMSDPFSMQTLPLPSPSASEDIKAKIRKTSRQRYAIERLKLEALLDAWAKKTFSKQEEIANKAMLEGLGLSPEHIKDLEDPIIQTNMRLFIDYAIKGVEPDEILFDLLGGQHKAIRYSNIAGSDELIEPQASGSTNTIALYTHKEITTQQDKALEIFIASADSIKSYIAGHFNNPQQWKAVVNVEKRKESKRDKQNKSGSSSLPPQFDEGFSINDIKIGESYEGYVKLMYNYGVFVTVKGVEGLLHKNFIVVPDGVKFKNYYHVGDNIMVTAMGFKQVDGEKKVVRTQK